jgi:hypothetical protein
VETLTIVDNDPRFGRIAAASLSQDVFDSDQSRAVSLDFSFDRVSGRFGYVLSLKQGRSWKVLRRFDEIGDFKGSHTLPVRRLFANDPIKAGTYRVRIFADENSRRLYFEVR